MEIVTGVDARQPFAEPGTEYGMVMTPFDAGVR
jgi:hypothetical protein